MRIDKSIYYALRRITCVAYKIRGIGLGRVCEFIRRWAAQNAPPEPLLIKDFQGDGLFYCSLQEHMGGQIFFRGSYSGDQLSLLGRLLKPDSIFVDIGANHGEFTIFVARRVPQGKVLSFEPIKAFQERLYRNIHANNLNNVIVFNNAISEHNEQLPIFDTPSPTFYDGTHHEGLPSLYASAERSHAREYVVVRTLDGIIAENNVTHIDIIKLDIEGAEWPALRGASQVLQRFRPILILEIGRDTCHAAGYEPEVFVEWLKSQEYRIEIIDLDGKTFAVPTNGKLQDFQNIVCYPL